MSGPQIPRTPTFHSVHGKSRPREGNVWMRVTRQLRREGCPHPDCPPHPGTSTLGAGRVPLPAHGPKFGFPSRSPRMTWGFSAAKSKLPLVFLNRWRLESWALTFPEGHKTLLSRCPLLFIAKSMKADTPLLGAMGKAPFPDAVTPDISGPAEATRMGSVVLGISGQGQAGCPPGGHCGH